MKNLTILFYATLVCLCLGTLTLNATTRYVAQTGSGSGTSWANASSNLQAMINASVATDEVWVATGSYKPTLDPFGNSNPTDPRDKTFYIKDGVKIYGGFAGTETNINQRNITANPTSLNGDIGTIGSNNDNAYHVVLVVAPSNEGIGVTIDGFTVRGGSDGNSVTGYVTVNGYSIYHHIGGGINITGGINTLKNNTLYGNRASYGGGIYIQSGENMLTNNTLYANTAPSGYGGGINIQGGINTLTNNILSGNSAFYHGGGISIQGGENMLTNNTLYGNVINSGVGFGGGGIYTYSGSTNMLMNNIFWGNKIGDNASIQGADYYKNDPCSTTFINNLLQLASSNYPLDASSPYGIGTAATGNIFAQDPFFVNAADIDGADNIHRTADDGLILSFGSSAYNTGLASGAPATDILGTIRPQFTLVDMGAYESTSNLAASSPTVSIGNIVNAICNTGGSMKANILSGTSPFTRLWSNGATTATISNLSAGTYTVTVTSANGYTASASATIINQAVAVPTGLTTTNITATTATFNWNAVTGATNYTIKGHKVGSATWTTIGPTTGTSKNIQSIFCGNTYEWKVRANCTDGSSSAFSATTTFTTTGCGVSGKTSSEWNGNFNTFSLQPNPAHSLATLSYFANANMLLTINVIDMTGRIVLQQNATITEGDNDIDMATNNLSQGYYVVVINDGKTQSYQKLLIVR